MSTRIGIGFSKGANAQKIAQEAAAEAKQEFGTDSIDLVMILSTIHYPPSVTLPVIADIFGNTRIVGCSTAGILLSDAIELHGLAVLAIASDEIKFGIGAASHIENDDIDQAGIALARNCSADLGIQSRSAFIVFIDSLIKNNSSLLRGIQSVFGNVFPIIGGGSCDDFRLKDAFEIYRNKFLRRAAVGLLLGGDVAIGISGRHGWLPIGKPRIINKTQGNIIKLIDNKYASSIYEEYLGKNIQQLHSSNLGQTAILYPLGIKCDGHDEYLLRNAVDIRSDGSILCQGEIPEESEVHMMIGKKDSCLKAAAKAAEESKKQLSGRRAKLILIIESLTRLKLLGRIASQELRLIKNTFGPSIPIFGFYANGEIYPFQTIEGVKKPHVLNESIVVLAVG